MNFRCNNCLTAVRPNLCVLCQIPPILNVSLNRNAFDTIFFFFFAMKKNPYWWSIIKTVNCFWTQVLGNVWFLQSQCSDVIQQCGALELAAVYTLSSSVAAVSEGTDFGSTIRFRSIQNNFHANGSLWGSFRIRIY